MSFDDIDAADDADDTPIEDTYLIFRVGAEEYAVPVTCVTEIVQSNGATALDSCGSSTNATRYVARVEVDPGNGIVTVTGQNLPEAVSVTLTPQTALTSTSRAIDGWICRGEPIRWMPGSCRGN